MAEQPRAAPRVPRAFVAGLGRGFHRWYRRRRSSDGPSASGAGRHPY